MGYAYHLQGDRAAASQAYTEAMSTCEAIGRTVIAMMAAIGLGSIQESENQLSLAAETYRRALQLAGDPPPASACEAHLGLARVFYQWNDLDAAQHHAQQSVPLARQIEHTDRFVFCEVFLACLKLARGDADGAAVILSDASQSAAQQNYVNRLPEIGAAQVLTLLRQGNLAAAAYLAQSHELPISQARVHLAQGDPSAALSVLEPLRRQMEEKGWQDELLKVMVLQTIALHAHGEKDKAVQLLSEALALAEPGGFIRIFVDEGEPMRLLIEKQSRNRDHPLIAYIDRLLAAFSQPVAGQKSTIIHQKSDMVEPLSERELEVLKLLRSELSGPEIALQLSVSINTFRTHTKNIFSKLGVNDRRAAIRRAEDLDYF
jgi:LuxR family maltose regulon positive regulatory protein